MNNALTLLEKAKNLGCREQKLFFSMAEVYIKTGKKEQAFSVLKQGKETKVLEDREISGALDEIIVKEAENASVNFIIGEYYKNEKSYLKAIPCLKKVIELKPAEKRAHDMLMDSFLSCKLLKDAVIYYEEQIRANPDSAYFNVFLATFYNKAGLPDKALPLARKAAKLVPEDSMAYLNMGESYRAQKKYDEAALAYKKVIELKSDSAEAYLGLGRISQQKMEHETALAYYEKAGDFNQEIDRVWSAIGSCYLYLNDIDKAITYLRKDLEINPADSHACYNLAVSYKCIGDYDEALKWYNKSISLNPEDPENYFYIASVYSARDNINAAIEACKKALELNPGGKNRRVLRSADYIVKKSYKKITEDLIKKMPPDMDKIKEYFSLLKMYSPEEIKEVIKKIENACMESVNKAPEDPASYYLLGYFYSIQNMKKEADIIYKKIIELNPGDIQVLITLGSSALGNGKYNEAMSWFEKAKQIDPSNAAALINIGICRMKKGLMFSAITILKQAVQLDPDNAEAWLFLGNASSGQRKKMKIQTARKG